MSNPRPAGAPAALRLRLLERLHVAASSEILPLHVLELRLQLGRVDARRLWSGGRGRLEARGRFAGGCASGKLVAATGIRAAGAAGSATASTAPTSESVSDI
jgi:hypothetical protein